MKYINIYYGYIPTATIDGNLHPDEQINKLHALLLSHSGISLDIFTNSIYILSECVLLSAYYKNNIYHSKNIKIKCKHFEYLSDGVIVEGKYYEEMISDNNLLNNKIKEVNTKFDALLEILQELENK